MLISAVALLISAVMAAQTTDPLRTRTRTQDPVQNQTQTQTQEPVQNRTQTQTQDPVQNQTQTQSGTMTQTQTGTMTQRRTRTQDPAQAQSGAQARQKTAAQSRGALKNSGMSSARKIQNQNNAAVRAKKATQAGAGAGRR